MLPDKANVNQLAIPPSVTSDTRVSFVKLSSSISLDVYTLAQAFNSAAYPPILKNNSPVWNVGESLSLPVVQCQDPSFPFCMPLTTIPPTTVIAPRRFASPILDEYTGAGEPVVGFDEQVSVDVVFTSTLAPSNCVFPAGFQRRPIFANRDTSDVANYVWVDAAPNEQAACGIAGTLDTLWPLTNNVTVQVIIHAYRLHSDGAHEVISSQATVTYAGMTVGGPMPFNVVVNLGYSGFYRFVIAAQFAANLTVPAGPSTFALHDMVFSQVETTDLGTAWYEMVSYTQGITPNGTNMWPLGIGTLFSFRANLMQNAGTIHGINSSAGNFPMFYQSTSQGRTQLASTIATDMQYGGGAGGKIDIGMWAYASPRVWLPHMVPVADCRLRDNGPPLSYWPCTSNGASVSNNAVWIYPTSNPGSPSLSMTFGSYVLVAFSPKNQFISPMSFTMIKADDMDAARLLLCGIPNFSPNDWHDFFSRVADAASKVGGFLKAGAEWIGNAAPQAIEAVSHAAIVAEKVGALAAMIA